MTQLSRSGHGGQLACVQFNDRNVNETLSMIRRCMRRGISTMQCYICNLRSF